MSTTNLTIESQTNKGENSDAFVALAAELQSTATRTSGKFRNNKARGVLIIVTTANEAATCSFTPKILGYDAAGTSFVLATFTAITTNATTILIYYPAVLTGFSGTEAKVGQLPRNWSLELTYAGTPANDKMDTKADVMYLI